MRVRGTLRVPGDKSVSHRALIIGALSAGPSRVQGILQSDDVHSTAGVLRSLGVRISVLGPNTEVEGVGRRGLSAPAGDLDCGNSGTTTRLMAGVVAACPFTSRFVGDASLSRRPMKRVARPLESMGARFEFERGDGLPMQIHGASLQSIAWVSEVSSAQIKSAILLAGLVSGKEVEIEEPVVSRDHTERMLISHGATVTHRGDRVKLTPVDRLEPQDVLVPADPSSAAFFAGLAALAAGGAIDLEGVCVNPTRTGCFAALARMGVLIEKLNLTEQGGEPVADVRVRPGTLGALTLGGSEIPALIDELPLIACLASRAEGETVITGAAELRVKESDRIAVVIDNLQRIGARAEELPDGMRIIGTSRPLQGVVRTHFDHRIAMAFGVLGALDENDIRIDHPECVSVSYPGFWDDLERVRRR